MEKTPEQYESEALRLLARANGDAPLSVRGGEEFDRWRRGVIAEASVMATLAQAAATMDVWRELTNSSNFA